MASSPKISPTQLEDVVAPDPGLGTQGWDDVDKVDARQATDLEHSLTLRDSFRLYPKAIGFSLLFSTAIIMEGYDLSLLGSFYGYDAFKDKFGNEVDSEESKIISADWQTYIQVGGMCGQIIGLYLNGWISDAIGYKKTMLASQTLMIALIFFPFFANNLSTLLAGNILLGIPWGVFQTLTLAYASDIAPMVLRPYLTAYVNLCWVIGQLFAAGVLRGFSSMGGDWSYRIPFALQWLWPPFIMIGTLFAPESPWWLVRKDRLDDARRAILKLVSQCDIPFNADAQVAMLKATNDMEIEHSAGTNYWHCLMRSDLRRTEIASISYTAQAMCGSVLMGYSVQFYLEAGLSPERSLDFNVLQYSVGAIGVVLSWFWMSRVGRRTIYLVGMASLFVILVIVGALGFADQSNSAVGWAIGSLLVFYTFMYDMAIGPICYTIVAEIPSTRLKGKTIVLARNFNNMAGLINNTLMPRMLGRNSWNWGAKTGLFWAAWCLVIFIWAFFRLPEPKDRTYGELDLLFEHGVSARKFASTQVDQFPVSGRETDKVQAQ
ncbi:general substrate transporter [Dactylonectria macrodidyma]|uniref:General substrate transporter n=2 Tax=Dactylonectria TaxID=1620264 RepID=A0A9P9CYJ3_9HYPO|nr:general substrate transporter [Dactylonectria macrodidyma]KAH7140472.1 general substrate transporter [Dactylonectria estremocensis]